MIKVMIIIEEKANGALDMEMQAVPFPPCTQQEKKGSAIVQKALEGMSEVMLSKAQEGQMIAEDDIKHRVKKGVEDWWDDLLTR